MASIDKRPNGAWRARYYAGGKQHARHFKRKVDAQAWLDGVTSSLVTGTYVDPVRARMTVAQWCAQWLEGYSTRRPSTVRQARVHCVRIVAEFGERPLVDVRPSDVRAWTARMAAEGLSDSYVYATYRRLVQIMADAVHDGLLPRSPCSRRTSPPQGSQRPYVATTGLVWALHDAMSPAGQRAVLLGAFVGLRVSEACALRLEDVDAREGVVHPRVQWGDQPLKSAHARTSVPVPVDLARTLVDTARARFVARTVVHDEHGRPVGPWQVERELRAVRGTVAGLPDGFRFHDLRHYYASMLIAAGLDVKVVQARLRHASATTTLNTYGHLWPDTDESSRAAVASVLATREDSLRTATPLTGA